MSEVEGDSTLTAGVVETEVLETGVVDWPEEWGDFDKWVRMAFEEETT